MKREDSIEQSFCRKLKQRYICKVPKLNVGGETGWPDRLILIAGAALFVEFKAPGKVPEPRQLYMHEELRQLHYAVAVFDDAQEALDWVDEQVKDLPDIGKFRRH